MTKQQSVLFTLAGAAAGANLSSTIGGVGLVGGFGGVGIGTTTMTGIGEITGAAAYGAVRAIQEGDLIAIGPVGLGAVTGAGISATVGGMGLSCDYSHIKSKIMMWASQSHKRDLLFLGGADACANDILCRFTTAIKR
ncbi:hypothetical protein [Moorena sp. SIO4G3]|uniref:hypothetical protein n=1 Tax=Moorena sp. SIO4G3 TaxID=2607821 RepID=UPI00142BB315|nr:hypothetical protein [Moorena sp. SIO4G3]NEO80200.1 hypothetical protein [Moorena sp. SIO4G3]